VPRNSKVGKKQRTGPPRASSGARVRRGRPKICVFCSQHATWVDYKDVNLLRRFMSDRGKIKSRGATGNCAQHQRDVAVAIKTAREVALLPYAVRSVSTEPGERRGRRGRPEGAAAEARSGSDEASKADGDDPEDAGSEDDDSASDDTANSDLSGVEVEAG